MSRGLYNVDLDCELSAVYYDECAFSEEEAGKNAMRNFRDMMAYDGITIHNLRVMNTECSVEPYNDEDFRPFLNSCEEAYWMLYGEVQPEAVRRIREEHEEFKHCFSK